MLQCSDNNNCLNGFVFHAYFFPSCLLHGIILRNLTFTDGNENEVTNHTCGSLAPSPTEYATPPVLTLPNIWLLLPREVGTITYRSGPEWEQRFGRKRIDDPKTFSPNLCPEFEIESYLDYQVTWKKVICYLLAADWNRWAIRKCVIFCSCRSDFNFWFFRGTVFASSMIPIRSCTYQRWWCYCNCWICCFCTSHSFSLFHALLHFSHIEQGHPTTRFV